MKLKIANNLIVIEDTNFKLKKYQSSQLMFWGYKYYENQYLKDTADVSSEVFKIVNYFQKEGVEIELSASAKTLFSDLAKNQFRQKELFEVARKLKNGIFDNKSFHEFRNFLKTLPRKLKTHQIKAAYHLYLIKNGANFSVPGSGKTAVILSVYEKLRTEENCNILYVVGPPSCFQPWQNEFRETLGRTPNTVILSGGNKKNRKTEYYGSIETNAELYLTTYQTLINDQDDVIRFLNQQGVNVFLVVDEAHYVKRVGSLWADSLLRIAKLVHYRCVLTGTPIPKSYSDIFNLFDFLWIKDNPLNEENKIKISNWEKNNENKKVKVLLDEKIGPLFYRVRKQDLGLKPAIFHTPIVVKMNPYENKIYEFIKSKIHELSTKDYLDNEDVLLNLWRGRIIRLRQAASHPKLLLSTVDNYDENLLVENPKLVDIIRNYEKLETTGKMDALNNLVLDLHKKGKKILIWSNFVGTLKSVKSNLSKLNLRSELIYGKTPRNNDRNALKDEMTREKIRDIFLETNSGLDILIANPAACAESISLHKTCFHAIYYDLSYNCAQYLQSLDRIHRVGGSEINTANYYFLQYESSIDQDIKTNIEIKAQKMYNIIEQDYEIYNLDMFEETLDDDIAAYKRLFLNTNKKMKA